MSENSRGLNGQPSPPGKLDNACQQQESARAKEFSLTAGLLTSLLTLPLCLPYYLVLIEESFESINQIAMDLDDEGSLRRLMLLNVVIVVKFLATLLPIPLAAALASLAPGCWGRIIRYIKPEWRKLAPAADFRRLFAAPHLTSVLELSGKCAIVLVLLYLELLHDLAGFIGLQAHYLKQSIFHGLQQWHNAIRIVVFIIILLALARWRG